MPANLTALANHRKRLSVDWEGETVKFSYVPFSWDREQEIHANPEGDKTPLRIRQLEVLLVEWDITEDGAAAPITRENLSRLPDPLLQRMNSAILEDMYPNPKRGEDSAAT